MADPPFDAAQLNAWLERFRAGDGTAADELIRASLSRLTRLTAKMLRAYPNVRRWADPDDVLQNVLVRLLHSLQKLQPRSGREFFALAGEHVRRELLDLARHYYGACGLGANYSSWKGGAPVDMPEESDAADDPAELERWCNFHEEVALLPVEEREVVGLIYYHGWEQAAVAELLGTTVRTVQRRWQSAMAKLRRHLDEREAMP
jgi:RNA polymerase sigma-70 factor (ECF subfamily)